MQVRARALELFALEEASSDVVLLEHRDMRAYKSLPACRARLNIRLSAVSSRLSSPA